MCVQHTQGITGSVHLIIGLNGEAGAGKDSVADVLVQDFGYQRIAFADGLKEALYAFNPYAQTAGEYKLVSEIVDEFGWDYAKHEFSEVRGLLQSMGVEYRKLDENVWIKVAHRKMLESSSSNIVFTDLRFENELKYLMSRNAAVIKVEREKNPHRISREHISEQLEISTPYVISNNGSLDILHDEVVDKMSDWNFAKGYTKKYLADGRMVCKSCEEWVGLDRFPPNKKTTWGVDANCRPCTNRKSQQKPSRTPDRRREEYEKSDKEQLFKSGRSKRLKKYGLTQAEYDVLFSKQGGVCAICLSEEQRTHHRTGRKFLLAVDHDHETGRVRGLLCTKCNKAIGTLGDTHEMISRVMVYLAGTS